MIHALSDNRSVPGVVVGIGSDMPTHTDAAALPPQVTDIDGRYVLYVGRIDENKGCKELFAFFERYVAGMRRDAARWCSSATSILPDPGAPAVRHLGFLDDRDKFDRSPAPRR